MSAIWIALLGAVAGWFAHKAWYRWQNFRDLQLIIRCSPMAELIPEAVHGETSRSKSDALWSLIIAVISTAVIASVVGS